MRSWVEQWILSSFSIKAVTFSGIAIQPGIVRSTTAIPSFLKRSAQ